MTHEEFVNLARNTPWAKALGYDDPSQYYSLSAAVTDVARHFWNAFQWTFRKRSTTFSTADGTSTYAMDSDVEQIEEMTYAEDDLIRYILPKTGDYIAKSYDGTSKVGSTIYYWDVYSYDNDVLTIRLTPTIDDTYTVTVRYLKKFDGVSSIPEKYHPIIMTGLKSYLVNGVIGDPVYYAEIGMAVRQEKPHRIKRSSVAKDRVFKGDLK